MAALKILAVVVLILVLLGLLRVGAVIRFADAMQILLCIGPFRLKIFPGEGKGNAQNSKEKPKEKPKKKPEKEPSEKKGRALKLTLSDGVRLAQTALTALDRSLHKLGRGIRIDPMRLSICVGEEDPADAAQTYGYWNAAVWTLMPMAEKVFHIPNPHIHIEVDFQRSKTAVEGIVGISFRILDLTAALFSLSLPLLKWYLSYKKDARAERGKEKIIPAENEAGALSE